MLAKLADELPEGGRYLYEPKWDGFRAIVFRGEDDVLIQSRDLRPLDRYFPELHDTLLAGLPANCVVDGEIVIATRKGLDFDALQLRLHPAASRVAKLAQETPSSFVGFDLLAVDGADVRARPQSERRALLERLFAGAKPPIHLTPRTRDRAVATEWLARFEGAGLDGVVAKPENGTYQPGKRAMIKIKHARTAECVVAGFRWHKSGGDTVGSLLLGLYDARGTLHHIGVTSSFTMVMRKQLARELAPLRKNALKDHPWREWAEPDGTGGARMPGAQSRWSAGKDMSWEPLRIERVVQVAYDHMQGSRFRHTAQFRRWRDEKRPEDCTFAQLEVVPPEELAAIFAGAALAATATPFGGATTSGGILTLVSNTGDSDTANDFSGATFSDTGVTTFASLAALSAEFNVTDDDCSGGSPRFQLEVQTASGAKNVFVYLGPTPSFTGCSQNVWIASGNLVGSTDGRFDTSQVQAGTQVSTYAQALALVGSLPVTKLSVVVDSGWAFPDKEQTVEIRNVTINGSTFFTRGKPGDDDGDGTGRGNGMAPGQACKSQHRGDVLREPEQVARPSRSRNDVAGRDGGVVGRLEQRQDPLGHRFKQLARILAILKKTVRDEPQPRIEFVPFAFGGAQEVAHHETEHPNERCRRRRQCR